jgi:hypothetical protein
MGIADWLRLAATYREAVRQNLLPFRRRPPEATARECHVVQGVAKIGIMKAFSLLGCRIYSTRMSETSVKFGPIPRISGNLLDQKKIRGNLPK